MVQQVQEVFNIYYLYVVWWWYSFILGGILLLVIDEVDAMGDMEIGGENLQSSSIVNPKQTRSQGKLELPNCSFSVLLLWWLVDYL